MKLKNKKLADEWFERAESDLLYARAGEKETQCHAVTCFLCHQAAEKVLKGLIVGLGGVPQKTHNLRLLLAKVKESFPEINFKEEEARRLEAFYIPSRYPGPVEQEFNGQDAKTALEMAGRLLKVIESLKV